MQSIINGDADMKITIKKYLDDDGVYQKPCYLLSAKDKKGWSYEIGIPVDAERRETAKLLVEWADKIYNPKHWWDWR